MDDPNERAAHVMKDWTKFLNPERLRGNLLAASAFIAGFECLMTCVVKQVRDFFITGHDGNNFVVDDETYRNRVLSRAKGSLDASLLWLKDLEAIDDADIAAVKRILKHRNEIAHELPKYVSSSSAEIDIALLGDIKRLVAKIDRYFFLNVEVAIDPHLAAMAHEGAELEKAVSMNMMFLDLLVDVALENGEFTRSIYEGFVSLAEADAATDRRRRCDDSTGGVS